MYPYISSNGELVNCANFRVAPHLKHLYAHLLENGSIRGIENYHPDYLYIRSKHVLELVRNGDHAWEKMVPPQVAAIIKERGLFHAEEGTAMPPSLLRAVEPCAVGAREG